MLVIGPLLGLGLKFCIKSMQPDKDSLSIAFNRMRRDVRLKYIFAGEENDDKDFNARLYIKSEWDPDDACYDVENRINKFEQVLTDSRNDILANTRPSTNLSLRKLRLLKILTKHPDFVIVNSDKNLGPAIIEREEYVKYILKEHLCNGITYEQLTEDKANSELIATIDKLEQLVIILT